MKELIGLLLIFIGCGHCFIVPQELPSILSLVYSNIPPIKKGTDSRIGFGYRLGEHADFQVLFELGPQTNTRPIGGGSDDSDTSKRNVDQSDYNKTIKLPAATGEQWLNNWSENMKKTNKPTIPIGSAANKPVQSIPLISESALKQLQQLYNKQQEQTYDIGTLPAESLEIIVAANKSRKDNEIKEGGNQIKSNKEKAKIMADLQDVNLDDDE